MKVPVLRLSAGQVLRALGLGQEPDTRTRNEVRYLRQLGVPHQEAKVGQGRGNRLTYGYEDLIEIGVAIFAMRRGMKPKDAATVLIKQRKTFRTLFRDALEQQPERALEAEWIKSRGRSVGILAEEMFLRLHDRYSAKPGSYQLIEPDRGADLADFLGMREVLPDGGARVLVPLTRIALELTYWALQAPQVPPGRRARA